MAAETIMRDYSLTGPEAKQAVAAGLASARWYSPPITRAELKELMRRDDGPAIRDTLIWFAAFIVSGGLGYYFWGSWAAVPFFVVYGVLYGSSTDSRWHECGHRTAFKTQWMNDAVYQIACFMIMREPEIWRWSHTRHHTDTIIVGRDPEIISPRPPDVLSLLLNVFALKNTVIFFRKVFLHAAGRLTEEEMTFVPESERPKVYFVARIYLAIYALRHRRLLRFPIDPAGDVYRPADDLRGMACDLFRRHPASRFGGGRARSSLEFAHRLHEPDLPLPVLEYELPRGAPHLPDGPLSRVAQAA